MNIQEYLKQCSVKSVDELTDEQVVDYYTKGNAGIAQKCAVELALQNYSECAVSSSPSMIFMQIMTSIRKAMVTKVKFGMTYITNESAIGPYGKESRWVLEP